MTIRGPGTEASSALPSDTDHTDATSPQPSSDVEPTEEATSPVALNASSSAEQHTPQLERGALSFKLPINTAAATDFDAHEREKRSTDAEPPVDDSSAGGEDAAEDVETPREAQQHALLHHANEQSAQLPPHSDDEDASSQRTHDAERPRSLHEELENEESHAPIATLRRPQRARGVADFTRLDRRAGDICARRRYSHRGARANSRRNECIRRDSSCASARRHSL